MAGLAGKIVAEKAAQKVEEKAATGAGPAGPEPSKPQGPAAEAKPVMPNKPAGPKPPSPADGGASPSDKPKMEPPKPSPGGGNKGGMAFSAAGQLANHLSKLEVPIKSLTQATSNLSKDLEQVAKPLGQIADAANEMKHLKMKKP